MSQNITLRTNRFKKLADMISAYSQIHLEESKLRLELPIEGGKSQYIFNPKKDKGIHETTLDRNDVFVPSQLGLFIGLRNNTTPQVEKLFAYVPVNDGTNPSVFPVAMTSESAEAIYAGYLQWLVDNAVMISEYPCEQLKKVPQTQGAFVLNSNNEAVQEGIQPEFDMSKMCETIIPRLTIAGTRDHKIYINFNAAGLTFPCTDGWTPYLVLYMPGFLIKGGCEYFDGKNAFGPVVGQW